MTRPRRKLSEEHKAKISATMSRPDVMGRRITSLRETNERRKGPRWVENADGCWIWQWGSSGADYPSQGQRRRIYLLAKGPCPRGMQMHHECGVRLCVAPDHQCPLTRAMHMALHAILRRRDWMDLPVPERIELSRQIIEGELARVP